MCVVPEFTVSKYGEAESEEYKRLNAQKEKLLYRGKHSSVHQNGNLSLLILPFIYFELIYLEL